MLRSDLYLLALIGIVALGVLWFGLTPVPDWRATVHQAVLGVGACTLPLAATPAIRRAERPRWAALGAVLAALVLLALAGLAGLRPPVACRSRVYDHARLREVEVETFCPYWNSSAGDCTRRRHPVYFGLFLGPADGATLPCG